MRKSKVLQRLRNNSWALMLGMGFTSPKVAELAGIVGFDCLWIDMEHRPLDYNDVFSLVQAARAADIDCIVRVRKESYADYFRVLEDGASGIMVPHCRSPEEVRFAVENGKYPPLGARGIDGTGADSNYGLVTGPEYFRHSNEETVIAIQIEDKEAVECVDEMACVEGFDLFFVGLADLSKSYHVLGEYENPVVMKAIEKISNAARSGGKWWGVPAGSIGKARKYLDMGARLINCDSDRGVLVKGLTRLVEDYSALRSGDREEAADQL